MRWLAEYISVSVRIIIVRLRLLVRRSNVLGIPRKLSERRIKKKLITLYKQRIALQKMRDAMGG